MRVLRRGEKQYRLPGRLSVFQEELYIHLIDWKREHITEESGTHRGNIYDAILPEAVRRDWPLIYSGVRLNALDHLGKFPFRVHKFFDHMASSQAANINLLLPIVRRPKAADILQMIKPDFDRLATDHLDAGIRIEFWDEPYGVLNDKTDVSGTDSDLAIAYYDHSGKLRLWLIEHKLSEAEFTTCGGYRSKGRRPQHDCGKSFAQLLANPNACYYQDVNKYRYWNVTIANQHVFVNDGRFSECPFQGGMNQLWRNLLLALAVEQDDRQPYEGATFSVVRHPGNRSLDKTIAEFHALTDGNPRFSTFTSADVLDAAAVHADDQLRNWVEWYRNLYDIKVRERGDVNVQGTALTDPNCRK